MSEELSVILLSPDGSIARKVLPNQNLETLQALVGGHLEFVPQCSLGENVVGMVNEEGKLLGLPPNPVATECFEWMEAAQDFICGPMVLAIATPDGDLASYPITELDLTIGLLEDAVSPSDD